MDERIVIIIIIIIIHLMLEWSVEQNVSEGLIEHLPLN
jgi:hypothetical protein